MSEPFAAPAPSDADEVAALRAALGPPALEGLAALLVEHCARMRAPLAVKDADGGRYRWANAAFAELSATVSVAGLGDAELFAPQAATLRAADQAVLARGEPGVAEQRLETPAGVRVFAVLRVPFGDPGARRLACLWSDVGAERAREARLAAALMQIEDQQRAYETLRRERHEAARHEAISGLPYGDAFDELMRREIDLSSREHREFALVLVALDAAPAAGGRGAREREAVVQAVVRQLRERTRAMDASCRLGEERFAVLLSGVGLATAHARMESLRRQCAAEIVVQDGRELAFSVAMGVASYPHTADAQEALVAAAEQALAEALRRGGNQVALAPIAFGAA